MSEEGLEAIQKRFDAWWSGEIIDRPLIQATAPRRPGPSPDPFQNLADPCGDPEEFLHRYECCLGNEYYAGDAFPCQWINLGPGILTAFLGCPAVFDVHNKTCWQTPIVTDWSREPEWCLREDDPVWTFVRRTAALAVERGAGMYLAGITDLGGNADLVAAARGTEALCLDLFDAPDRVTRMMARFNQIWRECYDRLDSLIRPHQGGASAWIGQWCSGRTYPIQCDVSALLSPDQFEAFCVPYIEEQAGWLDRACYHLDGPDALRHLDRILAIKGIHAIQWVPGAGRPRAVGWPGVTDRIQSAGKGLHVLAEPEDVPLLLERLRPEGLLITVRCRDRHEADGMVRLAWGRGARR